MPRWAPPELVSAAQIGDQAAAEQLIAEVWPRCYRLAATVIGDRNLAQDAAQDVCVIVHRKIRSLRNANAFDTWLYRIIMREAGRVRRQHKGAEEQTLDHALGSDVATTIDVWRALASLSPDLRDVTVLFYFDDLKSTEIATILGVAHPTVRTRLARARAHLRGLLEGYGDDSRTAHKELHQHAF